MKKERPEEEGPGSIDHFSQDRDFFHPRQGSGGTSGKENSSENGHLLRVYSALAYFFFPPAFSLNLHVTMWYDHQYFTGEESRARRGRVTPQCDMWNVARVGIRT